MKGIENKMITKKNLLKISCTAIVGVIALSLVMVFGGCKEEKTAESSAVDVLAPVEIPTEPTLPVIDSFSEEQGLTGLAKVLLQENKDVVGYIKISNTNVDYPVVQYHGDDLEEEGNWYYLDKDLYREYLESGSIFMDYRDNFESDESKQSENIVLYGHNMLNGSKFATLHYYRQDESFYDENPIIEFSSNYQDYKYVIIGYFITSGDYGESYYGEEFAYWDQEELDTEKDFNKYVSVVRDRSYVTPDIDVAYGDKLLTLQTCYMDEDNSRLLVVARRLRDHETVDSIDKIQSGNKTEDATESDSDEIEDSDE